MEKLNDIRSLVDEEVISCYKTLHKNPELGFLEKKTSKFIAEKLKQYGVETTTDLGSKGFCNTGVMGIIKGINPGKTVLLRADIDALPIQEQSGLEYSSTTDGVMHACGHDAHASMLLGAAKYLSKNRHLINGEIRFLFQPGEEGPAPEKFQEFVRLGRSGADQMIDNKVLEGVDVCFGIHVLPTIPTGELLVHRKEAMASTDMYKIEVTGKGGHGSAPHLAIDPVPAISNILSSISLIPSREIDPLKTCVVSVGTINTPSSSWNVIPEKVEITGTFRTFCPEVREIVANRIGEIAKGIAKTHRCEANYIRNKGYSPTINHENIVKFVKKTNDNFMEKVHLEDKPFTAGEDFGSYLENVEGALIWLGCGLKNEDNVFAHNPKFKVDLEALSIGVQVHVNNSLEYLNKNRR